MSAPHFGPVLICFLRPIFRKPIIKALDSPNSGFSTLLAFGASRLIRSSAPVLASQCKQSLDTFRDALQRAHSDPPTPRFSIWLFLWDPALRAAGATRASQGLGLSGMNDAVINIIIISSHWSLGAMRSAITTLSGSAVRAESGRSLSLPA